MQYPGSEKYWLSQFWLQPKEEAHRGDEEHAEKAIEPLRFQPLCGEKVSAYLMPAGDRP